MANIQGIPDAIKADIVDYCNRNATTQVDWVKKHIAEDKLKEQAPTDQPENS